MSKFIITGLPRSGTKFLSHTFNKSKKYKVTHDLNYGNTLKMLYTLFREGDKTKCEKFIKDRLSGENVGEISGAYRLILPLTENIGEIKKGIILRHPEKMIVSISNMQSIGNAINYMKNMENEMKLLDNLASTDEYKILKFQDFTRNKEILVEIAEYFGITDIDFTKIDITKKIHSTQNKYSIDDFPKDLVEEFREKIKWFTEKYKLNYV
jgi:hypothetical protein